MANAEDDYSARIGAYAFIFFLWLTGWGYVFWGQKQAPPHVQDNALMPTVPDEDITFQVRVAACIHEGWVACGFAFFPALPWKDTTVPEEATNLFKLGQLDFGPDTHYATFVGACAYVPVAFVLLNVVEAWFGAEQFLMAVDFLFESMLFPITKQFLNVLSCTRGDQFQVLSLIHI